MIQPERRMRKYALQIGSSGASNFAGSSPPEGGLVTRREIAVQDL